MHILPNRHRFNLIPASVLAFFLASTISCFANNNYFLPGDAFFYFEVSQAEWIEFKNESRSTWDYDRPRHLPRMFCGYAGYRVLDVSPLTKDYRARFINAVDSMKKSYPTTIKKELVPNGFADLKDEAEIETNQIRIFVYNRSFDFSKRRIALKYNEQWPEVGERIGHRREHFQFDFFVNSPKAIAESWRMASKVHPLDIDLPTVKKKLNFATPLVFDPEKLQILVAPPVAIESLCFPPSDSKLKCFVVTKDRNYTLLAVKRQWKPKP